VCLFFLSWFFLAPCCTRELVFSLKQPKTAARSVTAADECARCLEICCCFIARNKLKHKREITTIKQKGNIWWSEALIVVRSAFSLSRVECVVCCASSHAAAAYDGKNLLLSSQKFVLFLSLNLFLSFLSRSMSEQQQQHK
jgi:hypothetical protein